MPRATPYSTYHFMVSLDGNAAAFAGFSDVSGLNTALDVAGYREGNLPPKSVRKPLNVHQSTEVTLKRGVANSGQLSAWLEASRSAAPGTRRDVSISLQDERGRTVKHWTLRQAHPIKYTGPALNAKGTDVAMEELVLSHEGIILD